MLLPLAQSKSLKLHYFYFNEAFFLLSFCCEEMTTTNGVASWRLMSDNIDGFDLSPADREEVHVLAVDDSLVDRKVFERFANNLFL